MFFVILLVLFFLDYPKKTSILYADVIYLFFLCLIIKQLAARNIASKDSVFKWNKKMQKNSLKPA